MSETVRASNYSSHHRATVGYPTSPGGKGGRAHSHGIQGRPGITHVCVWPQPWALPQHSRRLGTFKGSSPFHFLSRDSGVLVSPAPSSSEQGAREVIAQGVPQACRAVHWELGELATPPDL